LERKEVSVTNLRKMAERDEISISLGSKRFFTRSPV
jgi:hypothetical protein